MRIGQIVARTGIAASTLRYYEKIGLIGAPERVNGQRWYSETIFRTIKVIRIAKRAGFSLDEIRLLLHDDESNRSLSERWKPLARHKSRQVKQIIRQHQSALDLLEQSMDCICDSMSDCEFIT